MEEDDWDLQAVVRGCFRQTAAAVAVRDPFSSFPPSLFGHVKERVKEDKEEENDDLIFPDLFSTQTVLEELVELCKPFFPKSPEKQHQLSISPRGRNPSSTSATSFLPAVSGVQPLLQPRQPRPIPHTPRSKRRKNPQKRVVTQVPADGISSDMWAWRKYGQKPIKGSPYPRGYYRCSSSKGCPARKQVERSRTDPGMFVISYTADHNHPRPTHRNSLAGSTRHKFPSSSSSSQQVNGPADSCVVEDDAGEQPHKDSSSSPPPSPMASTCLSPTTPLTSSMEDELLLPRQGGCKKGEEEDEEEEEEENSLLVEDMDMMGDEDMLFLGLEELREPAAVTSTTIFDGFAEQFSAAFPSHWGVATSTTTAAGGC